MVEARTNGLDAAAVVELDTYGFRIPCRSFYVKANVTRDRRLPVVDEHALRLVQACGVISITRIRDFFGMTRSESEKVVKDLIDSGLLVVEGDDVRLSTDAMAMFRTHPDEEARLMTVEPWIENVWIDLISHAFVSMPRTRPPAHLIEVPAPPRSLDLPEAFARTAFEDNFHGYVRTVKRVRDPDRVSIHSIAEVEADRYGSVAVVGRNVLDSGSSLPRFEVLAVDPNIDGSSAMGSAFKRLVQSLADSYGRLERPRSSLSSIEAFERLTGHSMRRLLDPLTGILKVDVLRQEATAGPWVLGASYLGRNIEQLQAAVHASGVAPEASIKWMRPGGTSWGLSVDLIEALAALRTIVVGDYATELLTPRTAREDSRRRFARLFDKGFEAPARLGGNLEILLVGACVAIVMIHLPVDTRETIPVGVLVRDRTAVQRIAKTISSDTTLWARRPRSQVAGH